MQSEDRKLIAAFQAGDEEAFNALYRQYAGRVLAFARQITGSRTEAEDLTQETFLAAYKGLIGFRGQANLLTWIFSILVRRWRDQHRSAKPPLVAYIEGDEAQTEESLPSHRDGNPEHRLTAIAIGQALETLEPAFREAFVLVAVQGLTHREAACVLQQPVGTVKWRVAQATQRVRKRLQESDAEETKREAAYVRSLHT
ncbi:MAG TPA: RNA polymerase sigma factor [Chthonomonadaceae bacterium]|nr:RNA polymerase sigma factor [Chthonomonadaceae bacterium]